MRCHATRLERWVAGFCALAATMTAGCGSPPSVLPLLEVSERAIRAEAKRLESDGQREAQWIEQTRASLKRAYERDMAAQSELTAEWVDEATRAYVAAREELVRHQMRRARQRATRRDNLRAASEAVDRARAMLQQQDELLTRVVGGRAWELLEMGPLDNGD